MKLRVNPLCADGFPLHIDTIRMGLPFVYFKGSRVEFSQSLCIPVPKGCFYLSKQ